MSSPAFGAVPVELTGLWRREVITAPGLRDASTRVVWLQTRSWYADLRVPADRPGPREPAGFSAYADAELVRLAAIQGFAGELAAGGGVCFWRRDLDRQPPGPVPDEARFSFDGPDVMIEDGIHADYQEIWRRAPGAAGPLVAFRRVDPGAPGGLLVIAGEHMIEVRAAPGPAPEGPSLAALVEARLAAGDRRGAERLLDTQIRYAVRDAQGWRVRLSSHPWLEDRPMWPAGALGYDAAASRLIIAGAAGEERWELLEADGGAPDFGRLLAGAAPSHAGSAQAEDGLTPAGRRWP